MISKEYLDIDPGSSFFVQAIQDAALTGKAGSELSDSHRLYCTTFKEKVFGAADDFDVFDGGTTDTTKAQLVVESFEMHSTNGVHTGSMTGVATTAFIEKLFSGGSTTNYTFEMDAFNKSQHVSTKIGDDNIWFQMFDIKSGGPLKMRLRNRNSLQTESTNNLGFLTRFYLVDFQLINDGPVVISWANQMGCPDTIQFSPNI